jgi:hypothetical protein
MGGRKSGQQLVDLLCAQRLREVEALAELAPEGAKTFNLSDLLYTLADSLQIQGVSELDDGLRQRATVF